MNPSQLLAWLICLGLAFFAAVLAVNNAYKVRLLQRSYAQARQAAEVQSELLAQIHAVLVKIEARLQGDEAPGRAQHPPAAPPDPAAPEGGRPAH